MMWIQKLMPSCRQVTDRLAEGGLDDAGRLERALTRLHLFMCEHCRRFARQMELLVEALRAYWTVEPPPERLEALKRRIMARLK